jgi:hypothetical protein
MRRITKRCRLPPATTTTPLSIVLQRERHATKATRPLPAHAPTGYVASATYILPYRRDFSERERNLRYSVQTARTVLGPTLDIVVVHQAAAPLDVSIHQWLTQEYGCRVVEQHNGGNFDRAWAFNSVVLHHHPHPVCIFGDVDMPLQANMVTLLQHVHTGLLDFVSPYHRIHSLTESGTVQLLCSSGMDEMELAANSHGYTFSGGIMIANTRAFVRLGLWYEVSHYGHEDHVLDVVLECRSTPKRCRVDHCVYLHLWHPRLESDDSRQARERDVSDLVDGLLRCTLGHYLHPSRPFTNACGRPHNVNPYFWILYALQHKGNPCKYATTTASVTSILPRVEHPLPHVPWPKLRLPHHEVVLQRSDVCVTILTRDANVVQARARLLLWQRALGVKVPVRWAHIGRPLSLPLQQRLPGVTYVPGAAATDAHTDTGFARALNAARRTYHDFSVSVFVLVRADMGPHPPPPRLASALAAAIMQCGTTSPPPAVISPYPTHINVWAGHCVLPANALPLFETYGHHADARLNTVLLEQRQPALQLPRALNLLPAPPPAPTATAVDALAIDALAVALCGCHGQHGAQHQGPPCVHRVSVYMHQLHAAQHAGQPLTVRAPLLHFNNQRLTQRPATTRCSRHR